MQTEPALTLARLAGGITYQPQFTFQTRRLAIADEIKAELLRASPSSTWPPRGFEVDLAERDKVRIGHLRHEGWLALVSESDIYFQYDYPDIETLDETLRVQTELYSRITSRLSVEPIRSIGIKFVSIHRSKDASEVAAIIPRLVLIPEGSQSPFPATPLEATIRVSYPLVDGATASLQIAVDVENAALVLDLDCAFRDTFAIPTDHLDFYTSCKARFYDISLNIRQGVLPAKRNEQLEG